MLAGWRSMLRTADAAAAAAAGGAGVLVLLPV